MDEPPVEVREFPHGSTAWNESREHRDRILRRPLGRVLDEHDLRGEETQRHFGLFSPTGLLAGLIALPSEGPSIRLRQMWVTESHQGHGLGRRLLAGVADRLASEGIRVLSLHAREPVIGFYERCGYHAEGPVFEEIGIPHRLMRLDLTQATGK